MQVGDLKTQIVSFLLLLLTRLLGACCRSSRVAEAVAPPVVDAVVAEVEQLEAAIEAAMETQEEKAEQCESAVRQRKATPPTSS